MPETIPSAPEAAPTPPGRPNTPPGLLERISQLRKNPIVDLVITLIVAVILAYGVQRFVVKPYRIPSASMERTLHISDRVLAVRFIYRFENPHRGDILVFHPNGTGGLATSGTHVASVTFIKRLIGLPGDWVRGVNAHVQICTGPTGEGCKTLTEPYISSPQLDFPATYVPRDHYFMMGDNRSDSDDSRDWGSIRKSQIIGRAFLIYWPPDRIHVP